MTRDIENGRIKIGPGWAAIIVALLSSIFGHAIMTYVHFQRIDDRLDRIELILEHQWGKHSEGH